MPKTCSAWNCTNDAVRNKDLTFSIFPDKTKFLSRWEKWVQAVRRSGDDRGRLNWEPQSKWVYLCGEHFITGRSNKDLNHPDHVPSVFAHKKNDQVRNQKKLERYSSVKKRSETPKVKTPRCMSKTKLEFESPVSEKVLAEACANNTPQSQHDPIQSSNDENPGRKFVSLLSGNKFEESDVVVSVDNPYEKHSCQKTVLIIPSMLQPPPMCENFIEDTAADEAEMFTATPITTSTDEKGSQNGKEESGMRTELQSDERRMMYDEMDNLRKEKNELADKLCSKVAIDFDHVKNKENETRYLTGLSLSVFMTLFTFLSKFMMKSKVRTVSMQNQFLLTLVKLRLNIPFEYMSMQNNVAVGTMTKIFWRWTHLMSAKIGFLIKWPDREVISQTVPPVFKTYFPKLTGIMDCFEIFTERPKGLLARAKMYSNYKKHSTLKVLIVCSANGAITFMSQCWGGRVSDVELVRQSGLLDLTDHMPGDQILADRGFTLRDDFAARCGVELLIPSFTKGKRQLSAKEVEISRRISSVRIHIERVIGCLRNRYTILKGPVNLTLVKCLTDEIMGSQLCSFDHILRACGALTNLGDGIVYNE